MCLQQIGQRFDRPTGPKPSSSTTSGTSCAMVSPRNPAEWTLEGRVAKKRTKEAVLEARQCTTCFCIFAGLKCPECGVERASKVREIEQREGELRELEVQEDAGGAGGSDPGGSARSRMKTSSPSRRPAAGARLGIPHRWRVSRHNPANRKTSNMTESEINRRIAVLCGWQEYRSEHRDEMRWRGPDGHNWLVTPDYCGDLNACREFEKRMSLRGKTTTPG